MRSVLPCLLVSVLPFAAGAATVTFDPENGFHDNVRVDDGRFQTRGDWNEAGFVASWLYDADEATVEAGIANFTGSPSLADCGGGCGDQGVKLSFSRPDDRPFSLDSIRSPSTFATYALNLSFTPFDADGALLEGSRITESTDDGGLRYIFDNLRFDATTVDGRTFSLPGSTVLYSEELFYIGDVARDPVPFQQEGSNLVTPALSRALRDLASLSISVVPRNSRIFDSIAASDIDPVFDLLPRDCTGSCEIPGFGLFEIEAADGIGSPNWGALITLDDFTFDVAPAPAPIPLPAGGALLLSALGALGLRARRRA